MKPDKTTILVPVLTITLGLGWLLTSLDVAPRIDWAWTLGLGVLGLLTFALGGLDKVTVVVGPFFLAASVLSILRQGGQMTFDVEVPLLVITAGLLMLVARSRRIPTPRWILEDRETP